MFLFLPIGKTKQWQWQAFIISLFPSIPAPAYQCFRVCETLHRIDYFWAFGALYILQMNFSPGYVAGQITCNVTLRTEWGSSKWSTKITSEGSLVRDKLARCHHLPQSHCNLCCVQNHTTMVLMMMAITAHNQRQAILRSSTYLEGEDHVVGSVMPSVLFSLHSFIH